MSGRMAKRARAIKDANMSQEEKIAGIVHRLCEQNSVAVNGLTPQIAFAVFGDVAMRMVFWLESLTQSNRGTLLKDFAAMLDHIARAELGELTEEEKAELLQMAEGQVGADIHMPDASMEAPAESTDTATVTPLADCKDRDCDNCDCDKHVVGMFES